jgi:hypothetical protein
MEPERGVTFLGAVSFDDGQAVAFNFRPDASAEEIAGALAKAEAERIEAQARETKRLRELFPIEGIAP